MVPKEADASLVHQACRARGHSGGHFRTRRESHHRGDSGSRRAGHGPVGIQGADRSFQPCSQMRSDRGGDAPGCRVDTPGRDGQSPRRPRRFRCRCQCRRPPLSGTSHPRNRPPPTSGWNSPSRNAPNVGGSRDSAGVGNKRSEEERTAPRFHYTRHHPVGLRGCSIRKTCGRDRVARFP